MWFGKFLLNSYVSSLDWCRGSRGTVWNHTGHPIKQKKNIQLNLVRGFSCILEQIYSWTRLDYLPLGTWMSCFGSATNQLLYSEKHPWTGKNYFFLWRCCCFQQGHDQDSVATSRPMVNHLNKFGPTMVQNTITILYWI